MSQEMDRLNALVFYMATKPALDDVAQHLVLSTFHESQPRTALISVFDSSGSVSAAGSFGFAPDVVRALRRLSLWDRSPAVDAIRDGAPVVHDDRQALIAAYPGLGNHDSLLHPTIAWPLAIGSQRLGSLQMQFAEPFARESIEGVFTAIAPLLGLYVSLRSTVPNGHVPDGEATRVIHQEKDPDAELTPRQMRILHLLADGMTNPQIAARIGYSDSTVRQETMAIYRHLGAEGRRDAVHIAGLRGLLNEDTLTSPVPALVGNRHAAVV